MVKRGREISNEEIYSTIWESREYSNVHMKVYYNALKRQKDSLEKYGIKYGYVFHGKRADGQYRCI